MSKYFQGWVDDPHKVEQVMNDLPHPVFSDVWTPIKGSGKGKKVLLYDIISKVANRFPIREQTVGDCVAQGAAYAVDAVKAVLGSQKQPLKIFMLAVVYKLVVEAFVAMDQLELGPLVMLMNTGHCLEKNMETWT
jgi:hypothetical protein